MLWYHQLDLYLFPEDVQSIRYPLLTFQTNSYDLFVSKPVYSFDGSFFVTAFSKSLWVAWIGAFGSGAGTELIRKLHRAVLVLVVSCQGIFFWTAISTFLTAERASTGQPFQNLNDLRISGEFSICVRENTPEYDFFRRSDLAALINRDSAGCPTEWDDRGKLIDQVCAAKRKIAFVEKSTLLHEFQMLEGRDFPCRVKRMFSHVYQNRRYFVARPGFGFGRRFNEV
ncbi:hypothetical protein pipiens_010054 [Culex pipiens pipiens]|uniref:Uncharacterized protein n=1 Tax=Culex pipiens pipiens TaxID=38569 RepID=A0ABD1DEZ2_CULPP